MGNTGSYTYGNQSLICIIYKYILHHLGLLVSSGDSFFFFSSLKKERLPQGRVSVKHFFSPHILRMFRKRYEELFWMYNLYIMYTCVALPHMSVTALTGFHISIRRFPTEQIYWKVQNI